MLDNFYFTKKKGHHLLILETNLRFPAQLFLIIKKKEMATIFLLLQDQLLYKDIKKQSSWHKINIGEYISLEKL
jgi:hypothetical protein